jgi:putative ABC transport system permease protein
MSMLGSAVGLLLAYGGLRLILMTNPGNIPRVAEIGIDTRVLLFSVGIAVLTGVFFGLAPLAQLAARSLNDSLKSAAGRATATIEANRLRRAMVVLELGLALVLLIGTGLMVRAFWKLQAVEVGLRPERVLTMRLALPQPNYPDAKAVRRFWVDLQQRVRSLPGVESASMMTGMPPMRPLNANDTQIEGFVRREGGPIQNVDFYQGVGDRYFETMGIRLIDGRLFDERDSDGGPLSVIVNQTMARTFWPEQGALGRRLRPGSQGEWRTVVGVVADVKNAGIDKPTGAELYFPIRQTDGGNRAGYLMVRTAGDPRSIFGAARAEVAALDPSLPVASVRTMEEVLESAQARSRFLTLLLTLFSTVALALAAVGIYGVMAYSVEQRTSEFGVRMAIGAQRGDVLGMVLRQGILLGLIGAAAGAAGAFGLTRLMRGLLFGVETFDPLTFAVMALLLVAVTTAACFVPARRATKVDPVIALRYE